VEPFEWVAIVSFRFVSKEQIMPRIRQTYDFTSIQDDELESEEDTLLEDDSQDQMESPNSCSQSCPVEGGYLVRSTCSALFQQKTRDASLNCTSHHRCVAEGLDTGVIHLDPSATFDFRLLPSRDQEVKFLSYNNGHWYRQLGRLHEIAQVFNIWLVDVEFLNLRLQYHPVPTQISIRRRIWT